LLPGLGFAFVVGVTIGSSNCWLSFNPSGNGHQILKEMNEGFKREESLLFSGKNKTFRKELLNIERALKEEHFKNLRKNRYKCSIGIIYSDMYNEIINLGNYALNVYDLLI